MSVLGSKDPLVNMTVWTSPQVPHCSLGKHISNEAKIIGSRKKKKTFLLKVETEFLKVESYFLFSNTS